MRGFHNQPNASSREHSARRHTCLSVALILLLVAPASPSLAAGKSVTEKLFVADSANGKVYVLQTTWKRKKPAKVQLVETLDAMKTTPTDVAVGGGVVLVVDDKFVWAFDAETYQNYGKNKSGKQTRFVTVTQDGKYALATQGKRFLKVVDLSDGKILKKIKTGKTPGRVRIDDTGTFGAVVNLGDDSITVFDLPTVLARPGRFIDGTGARAVDGVRTISQDVCDVSGGLDVAAFGAAGTWAIWSCGGSPAAAAQQAKISSAADPLQDYPVPGVASSTFVAWNPDCSSANMEDGVVVTQEDAARDGTRTGTTSFRYSWRSESTQTLGPGTLLTHFARVDDEQLNLHHPKGVHKGKVGAWQAPAGAVLAGVGSTLTDDVNVSCAR